MIDSHAHLDDAQFGSESGRIVERAAASGLRGIVSAGVDLESSYANLALAERYDIVYATAGFHPHEAQKLRPQDLEILAELAAHPKVVAIGEIGLDYFREHSPRDVQREALRQQLELASHVQLPVVVHIREADADTYAMLREWAGGMPAAIRAQGRLGMIHCFSGDRAAAERYVELGFHISLACPVTYPNAQRTREVAAAAPLERLLSETDSPYLPPQALRGKRNEPANVRAVAETIAAQRTMPVEVVMEQTALNAARLFGLPERS